ncbi:MAG: hypothetical protein NVS3B26_10210 [Mycobacteriales bacterium]
MRDRNRVGHLSGDSGAVAVLVAILSVVLMGMLGFAVDLGNAYATQRRLSTAADGAALAAAQELALKGTAATAASCSSLGVPDPLAAAAATTVAEQYNKQNADVQNGNYVPLGAGDVVMACSSGTEGTVKVGNREPVQFSFGRLFGVNGLTPPGAATARYGAAGSLTGLRPFGICSKSPQYTALLASLNLNPQPTVRLPFTKLEGDCGSKVPGNWGTIDLDNGPPSAYTKKIWIQDGYNKELHYLPPANSALRGDPGNLGGGAYQDELASITGKSILLPVYDKAVLQGSRAQFNIIGFVSVQFCGFRLGSKSGSSPCSLPDAPIDYFDLRLIRQVGLGGFCPAPANCVSLGVSVIALVK